MKKASAAASFTIPDDLAKALASQPKAERGVSRCLPSHQREYVKAEPGGEEAGNAEPTGGGDGKSKDEI